MKDVLVIDDERDIANSLAVFLRLWGHSVRVAYDGLDGLDAASASLPDVVVVDLSMPRMSGFEVAKRLRDRWGDRLRIIAHTAWSDDAARRRADEIGFDRYLVKPVAPDELVRAVASLTRVPAAM